MVWGVEGPGVVWTKTLVLGSDVSRSFLRFRASRTCMLSLDGLGYDRVMICPCGDADKSMGSIIGCFLLKG